MKEGYQTSAMPLTMVWVDGGLVFESHSPNCYNYLPSSKGFYDYLKFGIYKNGWFKAKKLMRGYKREFIFLIIILLNIDIKGNEGSAYL